VIVMNKPIQADADIHCAVCGTDTRVPGYGQQFGTLPYGVMAHNMTASVTACICASPVFSKRWPISVSNDESTRCLMMRNRQTTRYLAGLPVMIFLVSRNALPTP